MKKILSFTIILLTVINATAREASESLFTGSKIWTTRSISTAPPDYGGYTEFTETKLEGTIVVDDISFMQVHERSRLAEEEQFGQWELRDEYIGQKDNKVYLYFKSSNTMFPVMDFSLNVGDTYRQYDGSSQGNYTEYVVTSVSDTILNNSTDRFARKCIHLSSMHYQDVWIEGIGSVITGIYGSFMVGFHGSRTTLMKCIDGNDLLYQLENETNGSSCWAQTPYKPFVEEGKLWKMKSGNNDLQYFIKGDTVIGDKECKKLYSFNAGNTNAVDYKLALYETDRKVYFIPKNKEESYVLYDFTVPVNETTFVNEPLHPHDWPPLIMKNYERRSVNLMGTERTCVLMRRIHEDMDILLSGWWIEGVGGEQGPLNAWLFRAHGNQTYLKECSVNGLVIFSSSDFNQNITTISNICAPFMYEDKVWTMGYRTNQNVLKNSETKLCGDTIIDGIHFKRKYEREWLKGEKKPDEWTATDEYIGQNLGKVYMYSNKLKRAKIDMDFSLSEGDTFTCCGYEDNDERQTFLVTGIEQKWGFEDLVRKKFIYLQSKDNPDITDTWIEGIGSMTTGITGTSHLIPDGSARKLTQHTWGEIFLYEAEDFSTSINMVEQSKQSKGTIYDLQGRKIANSQLKAGIYIRDGRKVVVE